MSHDVWHDNSLRCNQRFRAGGSALDRPRVMRRPEWVQELGGTLYYSDTDISDFRPVPDHQEVFADGSLDQSLIIEVVEYQPVADTSSAAHFFNDLAETSQAQHSQIDETLRLGPADVPGVPAECVKTVVVGQQAVAKGRQGMHALNKIQVILCNIRIPQYRSDLLITLNTPIYISEHSAAAEHAGAGYKGAHLTSPMLFRQMLESLQITDWSLFGPPES